MRTFVINLARAADRRKAISERLDKLEIDFEIWPAVDGRMLNDVDNERFRREHPNYQPHRSSVEGHKAWVGCTRSHQTLCEHIFDTWDGPTLVLEDDAVLHENWEQRVSDAVDKFPEMELLLVGCHIWLLGRGVTRVYHPRLTHAYIIQTRDMARRLANVWLDESTEGDEVWWKVMEQKTTYALQPPAATQERGISYITGQIGGSPGGVSLNPMGLVDLAKIHLAERGF